MREADSIDNAPCFGTTAADGASSPLALRRAIRSRRYHGPTAGLAPGYLQGNLAIVPERHAGAFRQFCLRNPKPCPLIAACRAGSPFISSLGRDIDLRTDLAGYRVFRSGVYDETVSDLQALWREDLVGFVLGCSFSFEESIRRCGITLRHIEAGRNVAMYKTNIETIPAGRFHGPLVVSMRSFKPYDAIRAILCSDRYRLAHGAPIHIGMPGGIGIKDLMEPDFGDAPILDDGDIPVFWACGVTAQLAICNAAPDLAITHDPGRMLVSDISADAAESMFEGIYRPGGMVP
ncbi:MAG: putative hydro-lyase [Hyphomicrobiales bacterium]